MKKLPGSERLSPKITSRPGSCPAQAGTDDIVIRVRPHISEIR